MAKAIKEPRNVSMKKSFIVQCKYNVKDNQRACNLSTQHSLCDKIRKLFPSGSSVGYAILLNVFKKIKLHSHL